MCRYCNTITMHHASEGQASICVESVTVCMYGFLNGCPNLKPYWLRNGKFPFRNGKGCRNGSQQYHFLQPPHPLHSSLHLLLSRSLEGILKHPGQTLGTYLSNPAKLRVIPHYIMSYFQPCPPYV